MRKIFEKLVEALFTLSGAVTTITILLIVIFLFREGFGLFRSPAVERGYVICVNAANRVEKLTAEELKRIFDYEVEGWEPFRMEYEMTPEEIDEIIASNENIIAFLPEEYVPQNSKNVRILRTDKISASDFFGGTQWIPTATPAPRFGVLPLVLGTLWVSLAAILIALPLGLGVAIYLSELASERMRKFLKPTIELLAGIPSVVYGFFGLVVVVPLVQKMFNLPVGETGFTGAAILAIMALPTIITVAEDALRGTPQAMREASLALGATHWQTIYKVVVPYAKSGISAAVVLGIGRAIGETMAVLMVTGNAAVMPTSLLAPLRTIPATVAAELGEAPAGGAHYQALFLLGCILFLITLVISITSEIVSQNGQKS